MRQPMGVWLMSIVLWLFAACGHLSTSMATGDSDDLPLKILYSGQTCPCRTSQPELTWFDEGQGLAGFMRKVHQGLLGAAGNLGQEVDFSTQRVLAIAMGRKPTAGYGLGLVGEHAKLRGDTLEIQVQWNEPPAGAKLAQMLTSPCLLIQLPLGGYTQIMVKDQDGRTRASLSLL
jgi:hypothetical protein